MIEQLVHFPLTPVSGRDLAVYWPLLTLSSDAFLSMAGLDEGVGFVCAVGSIRRTPVGRESIDGLVRRFPPLLLFFGFHLF